MPKSAAFIRIKTAVLAVTRAIPPGRVTSFRAVGALLDVTPRHVAYILATLTDEEQAQVSWYRVVSDDGALERPKVDASGRSQAELLVAEGAEIGAGQVVEDFEARFFAVTEESTGVGPVEREPNAPNAPNAQGGKREDR